MTYLSVLYLLERTLLLKRTLLLERTLLTRAYFTSSVESLFCSQRSGTNLLDGLLVTLDAQGKTSDI